MASRRSHRSRVRCSARSFASSPSLAQGHGSATPWPVKATARRQRYDQASWLAVFRGLRPGAFSGPVRHRTSRAYRGLVGCGTPVSKHSTSRPGARSRRNLVGWCRGLNLARWSGVACKRGQYDGRRDCCEYLLHVNLLVGCIVKSRHFGRARRDRRRQSRDMPWGNPKRLLADRKYDRNNGWKQFGGTRTQLHVMLQSVRSP